MHRDDDHTLLLMAAAAAFVTSFVAVAQHVRVSAVGYEIDRAEKRQVELRIHLGRRIRESQDRLHFRSKENPVVVELIVERLDANSS